jgi:hypothetical protein
MVHFDEHWRPLAAKRKGRFKRLVVADSVLLEFLNGNFSGCPAYNSGDVIPGDAVIVHHYTGFTPGTTAFVLYSESFPEVEFTGWPDLPEIRPEFTRLD